MSDESVPDGLSSGGARLWRSLLAQDVALSEELNPNREVAIEACRAKDRCDVLANLCASSDVVIDNGKGQPVAHPAWVESRQQANILKQLIAALRLPDVASGQRPQRHLGASGVRQPNGVSSLDLARARAKSS